jgi:methyl-accepting chemotaxis protein
MAFGENVGAAYVKLYADGDGVPDDIRKAMEKIEPEWAKAGEEHAKAFDDAWNKQREKDGPEMRDNLAKDLQEGLGRFGAIGEQLGEDFFDGIQLQISRELENSDLGEQIRLNLEEGFERTGSFDRLRDQLRDLNGEIIRASDQLDQKFEKELRDAIKETDKLTDANIDWHKSVEDTRDAMRELAEEIDDGWEHTNRWVREIALAREESHGFATGFRGHLRNLNVELDKSATLTGKIFGKGSRNDFLNLVGSAVEGLTRLVYLTPNLLERLLGGGSGGGGGGPVAILKAVSSSIVGITVALAAVVAIAGPIAALVSGISAAVISLVGSLVFAAGAVGGVAFALTGPLVAGIGVAVLALANLDKETKEVLSGLGDEFEDLGKSAGKALGPGLREAAEGLRPTIAGLEPLIDKVARAIGRVAIGWSDAVQGDGFKRFRNILERFLPDAIESLGESTGNLAGGFGGIFTAAIPQAERFLDWLEDITEQFSEWANSKEGQEELKQFFEDAADSAIAVKDAVVDISDAIIELLDQGKDEGDDIFTTLSEKAQEFVDYLKDPENREAIDDFFENGKDTAEALGRLVLDLQQLIDDFDTDETREELQGLFDLVGDIIDVIGTAGASVTGQWQVFATVLDSVWWFIKEIGKAAEDTGDLLVDAVRAPDRGLTKLKNGIAGLDWGGMARAAGEAFTDVAQDAANAQSRALGYFRGLGNRIKSAIGRVDWSGIITDPTGKVVGWFKGMAGRLVNAAGNVNWGDVIKDPTDTIVGWFTGLGGRIVDAIGDINIDIDWPSPPGFLQGVLPGTAIGGVFNGAQARVIGEAGPEAVVPLNRPLHQVDPSVRELSAIAQGLSHGGGGGVTVAEGAIVVYEVGDGQATAHAVLNALVAKAA